jgi:hypothetical protein
MRCTGATSPGLRWISLALRWLLAATATMAHAGGPSVAIGLDPPPASIVSGATFELRSAYAVSSGPAADVVVWVTLGTTLAQDFGQSEDLQFVSATSGGAYTATALSINGADVPAGSVYWTFASLNSGTFVVRSTLRVPTGALDATSYALRAFIRTDSNGANASSTQRSTAAGATPMPAIALVPGTGWIDVGGMPQAGPGSTVQFIATAPAGGANNAAGNGVETLYAARAWVALDPLCALSGASAVACVAEVSDIGDGGVADPAFDPDDTGPLPAGPAVTWSIASIAPGASIDRRFRYTLPGSIADGTPLSLSARLDSARSTVVSGAREFEIGVDDTPIAELALGDDAGGMLSITAGTDDNPTASVAFEDDLGLALQLRNAGAVTLGDALLFVRVPSQVRFEAVTLPAGVDARAFHSGSTAFTDPTAPPPVDLTSVIGNTTLPADIDAAGNVHWQAFDLAPPSDPAQVTWLALYITALAPASPAMTARITWRSRMPACTPNVQSFVVPARVFSFTPSGGGEAAIAPGPLALADSEPVRFEDVAPQVALVPGGASVEFAGDAAPAQIQFTLSNLGTRTIVDATLAITWPTLSIQGVAARPEYVGAGGGEVDDGEAANGEIGIGLDPLAPGASAIATVSLRYPAGVVSSAQHAIHADAFAPGIGCGDGSAQATRTLLLLGEPLLQVSAVADQTTLAPGGDLSFTARHRNDGTAVATDAVAFGPVPAHATFRRAELAPGRRLLCSAPPLDQDLPADLHDAGFAFDAQTFATQFVEGTLGADGWTCPAGGATSWIAIALDDAALAPPSFVTGSDENWLLRLRNDEIRDDPDAQQQGSPLGTSILLEFAIVADGVLTAIGNIATSTVGNAPFAANCNPPRLATYDPLDYALPTSNGTAPLGFTLLGGSLPGCLALDAEGRLRGGTTQAGQFQIDVRVVDATAQQVDVSCTLEVVASGVFGDGMEAQPRAPAHPRDPCP